MSHTFVYNQTAIAYKRIKPRKRLLARLCVKRFKMDLNQRPPD